MNTASIKTTIAKQGNNFIVTPATYADRVNLQTFVETNERSYVNLTVKKATASKTYVQLKTAWALIEILFKSMYFRKPSATEKKQFYQELLDEYAERTDSLLHQGETVPLSFSEMSVRQLSNFIQTLINLLSESCDLEENDQSDVKNVFIEWQNYMSSQDEDGTDFDENGEIIPLDKWREKHTVSFASGLGGNLDLAHIVSRGADEIHKDCCWNTIMLTHEEHMLQHKIGWQSFLEIYPHLKGRVDRARHLAGKLALLEVD